MQQIPDDPIIASMERSGYPAYIRLAERGRINLRREAVRAELRKVSDWGISYEAAMEEGLQRCASAEAGMGHGGGV